jgi:hypothetical protein
VFNVLCVSQEVWDLIRKDSTVEFNYHNIALIGQGNGWIEDFSSVFT